MILSERLQEALCALSARGYDFSKPGYPMCGGIVSFCGVRRMPDGGLAVLHLDLRGDSFDASPETSEGRSGMAESGDACDLVNRIRSGR